MCSQLRRRLQSITSKLPAFVALLVILLIWQAACSFELVPAYMLPSPAKVVRALWNYRETLMMHAGYTLQETFYGLGAGILLSFVTATLMDRFDILDKAFAPLLVISQTIPTIAIAPILVLWFGYEMTPKIILVVLTTYFPITVGLLGGYKSVDRDSVDLMRSMGASRIEIFRHLKFPQALPQFFSGLRIAASYAVVGAVVAEWLGGFNGLGVCMTRMRKAYAFDTMFGIILFIVFISLLLLLGVKILSRVCMPWIRSDSE